MRSRLCSLRAMFLSFCVTAAVMAGAADDGARPTWPWERRVLFVQALATRRYYDIAERVVARLDADERIVGIERALLHRRLGGHYAGLAPVLGRERGLEAFFDALGQARARYRGFLDYPAVRTQPQYAEARRETRLTLCRITLGMAEATARQREDKRTPEADKPALAARATELYRAAIADFGAAIDHQGNAVQRVRDLEPRGDEALRRTWQRQFRQARAELFRVRLERNAARVRFARFLKTTDARESAWRPPLDAAEKDLRKLLLDFPGTPGAVQANLELARCLLEQGPQHDGEALERLTEVWRRRDGFRNQRRIPCEAARLKASVLVRQKKPSGAAAVIDEVLAFASDGAWDPGQRTAGAIAALLDDLPEDHGQDLDRRTAARALLLQAEAFALLGEQARRAGKPRRDVRRVYGDACTVVTGVLRAQRVVAPRYTPLIVRWLAEAERPAPPELLWQQYAAALDRQDYGAAARCLQQIAALQTVVSRERLPAAEKRKLWVDLGHCYHLAGQRRQAAYAFLAAARWFPSVVAPDSDPIAAAIGLAAAQHRDTGSPRDRRFLEWVQEQADALRPGTGAVAVRRGIRLRRDGRARDAIAAFQEVTPGQEAYPHALYQLAVTWRVIFIDLPREGPRGSEGRHAVEQMERAFAGLYALHRSRYDGLQAEGERDAARRLLDVVAAALAVHTDFCLREPVADPDRVLALSADLPGRFPGIEQTEPCPLILFNRMRAAYSLIPQVELDRIEELLRVVEHGWQRIQTAEEFPHREKGAKMGAHAHIAAARRLEPTDATRARRLLERGLAFYVQLLELAPDQPIATYHSVIHRLQRREHEPKSADWRAIVQIAPRAIERFRDAPRAARPLLDVRLALGLAYQALGRDGKAIGVLEPLDDDLEERLQEREREFRRRLEAWEGFRGGPRPQGRPARDARHGEIKQTLADSYLAAKARERYPRALDAYALLTRLYRSRPDRYAPAFHGLCETLVRLGRYEEAARTMSRVLTWQEAFYGGDEGLVRLRGLLARMRAAVSALKDRRRRADLEPFLDDLRNHLRK